ncbi:MAG: hypothetical protein HKN68_16770 [Saprospiraceae bacterium]|nr:hypothetical protein [Saprospiraceae bacterium]
MSEQITTITFCRYGNLKNKLCAFNMIARGHQHLKNVSGMPFYKLMGSGSGLGFNFYPGLEDLFAYVNMGFRI